MAEGQPFLLDQHDESLDGTMIGIQAELGETHEQGCAIPPVATMNQGHDALRQYAEDMIDARQDCGKVRKVTCGMQRAEPSRSGGVHGGEGQLREEWRRRCKLRCTIHLAACLR